MKKIITQEKLNTYPSSFEKETQNQKTTLGTSPTRRTTPCVESSPTQTSVLIKNIELPTTIISINDLINPQDQALADQLRLAKESKITIQLENQTDFNNVIAFMAENSDLLKNLTVLKINFDISYENNSHIQKILDLLKSKCQNLALLSFQNMQGSNIYNKVNLKIKNSTTVSCKTLIEYITLTMPNVTEFFCENIIDARLNLPKAIKFTCNNIGEENPTQPITSCLLNCENLETLSIGNVFSAAIFEFKSSAFADKMDFLTEIHYKTIYQNALILMPGILPKLKKISGGEILNPQIKEKFEKLQARCSKQPENQPAIVLGSKKIGETAKTVLKLPSALQNNRIEKIDELIAFVKDINNKNSLKSITTLRIDFDIKSDYINKIQELIDLLEDNCPLLKNIDCSRANIFCNLKSNNTTILYCGQMANEVIINMPKLRKLHCICIGSGNSKGNVTLRCPNLEHLTVWYIYEDSALKMFEEEMKNLKTIYHKNIFERARIEILKNDLIETSHRWNDLKVTIETICKEPKVEETYKKLTSMTDFPSQNKIQKVTSRNTIQDRKKEEEVSKNLPSIMPTESPSQSKIQEVASRNTIQDRKDEEINKIQEEIIEAVAKNPMAFSNTAIFFILFLFIAITIGSVRSLNSA